MSETKKAHSPVPWMWKIPDPMDDYLDSLLDAKGGKVCDFGYAAAFDQSAGDDPCQEDKDFIIKAVNNHEKLVAAIGKMESILKIPAGNSRFMQIAGPARECLNIIRDTLKAVQES